MHVNFYYLLLFKIFNFFENKFLLHVYFHSFICCVYLFLFITYHCHTVFFEILRLKSPNINSQMNCCNPLLFYFEERIVHIKTFFVVSLYYKVIAFTNNNIFYEAVLDGSQDILWFYSNLVFSQL